MPQAACIYRSEVSAGPIYEARLPCSKVFRLTSWFLATVDEDGLSAAARKVNRTRSAVSEALANLEAQVGVVLFDRRGRFPKLTKECGVLIGDARSAVAAVDGLKARAKGIAGGVEAELSVVVDVLMPILVIADAAREFRTVYPNTPLRLYVEALGGAVQPVIDGRAAIGVVGSLPVVPPASPRNAWRRSSSRWSPPRSTRLHPTNA